jgi:hypothetical protein
MSKTPAYFASDPLVVSAVEVAGIRTVAAVQMLKNNEPMAQLQSMAEKFAPSPTSRSSWCKISLRKLSSPLRTPAC